LNISGRQSKAMQRAKVASTVITQFDQLKGDRFMNIRPLHDRVIVTRLEESRKTASGIVIPDTAAEKPETGEVIAVGKGKIQEDGSLRALAVKKGDKILFGKYSGQTVTVEGAEYLVMREEDIMGVID
jgi:chaperonin GroES